MPFVNSLLINFKNLPHTLYERLRLFPPLNTERLRQVHLLEALLIGFISLTVLAIIFLFLVPLVPLSNLYSQTHHNQLLIVACIGVLFLGVLYFLTQHFYRTSSVLFIFGFTFLLFLSDDPIEILAGRSKFYFIVPIFLSSVLLRPIYSYLAAIIITITIAYLGAQNGLPQNSENTVFTFIGLMMVATIAGVVSSHLEQVRIDYQKAISELYLLRTHVLEAREEERGRLSRELHDGPVQDLLGIQIRLGGGDPETANEIRMVLRKLREICGLLRPPALNSFGLKAAIESHAQSFAIKHPEIKLSLLLDDDHQAIKESSMLALYRIYEQSMQNISLHARATVVEVTFYCAGQTLHLSIEDNGVGFEMPLDRLTRPEDPRYGITNGYERAVLLGGEHHIYSNPGGGTLVLVKAPLSKNIQEPTLDPYLVD